MTSGKRRLVIAIDGPVGAGKSTAARRLAEALGYLYIDSGAMYRALGRKAVQAGVDLHDPARLADLAAATDIRVAAGGSGPRVLVDGEDVTDALRTPAMDLASSLVSVVPEVRRRLVTIQRAMAKAGGIVMDGRDIGTVVFPDADVKIFLDAPHEVRARRRHLELVEKGLAPSSEVGSDLAGRDRRDSEREVSPLKMADDAVRIDTASVNIDEVVKAVLKAVDERLRGGDNRS